jgi:acetyltransferase-like isoleucine patch superfamily enzyme
MDRYSKIRGVLKYWLRALRDFILPFCPGNRTRIARGNWVRLTRNRKNSVVVCVGSGCRIDIHPLAVFRDVSVKIYGNRCSLVVGENVLISDATLELFGEGSEITVGSGTSIAGGFYGAHWGCSISIAEGCMFSSGVDIRTTDSHSIIGADGQRINPDKGVVIRERVWLARGVTVLKGSIIEPDSVVGAGAVVSGFIPAAVVAAGVPARVLRTDISWSRERL